LAKQQCAVLAALQTNKHFNKFKKTSSQTMKNTQKECQPGGKSNKRTEPNQNRYQTNARQNRLCFLAKTKGW